MIQEYREQVAAAHGAAMARAAKQPTTEHAEQREAVWRFTWSAGSRSGWRCLGSSAGRTIGWSNSLRNSVIGTQCDDQRGILALIEHPVR